MPPSAHDLASIKSALLDLSLPQENVEHWLEASRSLQRPGDDWQADGHRLGQAVATGWAMLQRLPPRSKRRNEETATADALRAQLVEACRAYCRHHAGALYRAASGHAGGTGRLEQLCESMAELLPEVFPPRARLEREAGVLQTHKDGLELFQGALVASWLEPAEIGNAIIAAMREPLPGVETQLEQLKVDGELDLDRVRLRVDDRLGRIEFRHPTTLNAEDETSIEAFERAVDLLLMHPTVQMGVLRGGTVSHPKYAGRRLFSAGINLTALYEGKQSFLWYIVRELGVLNKIYRGHLGWPGAREIPWMAVVDGFAIGGGCQILLVVDHVIAERGAYFNLPARKEGIIPGAANLRLPRFVGLRPAQAAILFGREFEVEEPAAAGLINAVYDGRELDARLEENAALALDSGMVSAAGNRRALREGNEPEDVFRRYMALYAWEQAWCHLSPQLAANLERHWKKAQSPGSA